MPTAEPWQLEKYFIERRGEFLADEVAGSDDDEKRNIIKLIDETCRAIKDENFSWRWGPIDSAEYTGYHVVNISDNQTRNNGPRFMLHFIYDYNKPDTGPLFLEITDRSDGHKDFLLRLEGTKRSCSCPNCKKDTCTVQIHEDPNPSYYTHARVYLKTHCTHPHCDHPEESEQAIRLRMRQAKKPA